MSILSYPEFLVGNNFKEGEKNTSSIWDVYREEEEPKDPDDEDKDDEDESENVVLDMGDLGDGKTVKLHSFSPEGATKGWAEAEAECEKAGSTLLELKDKKKQEKFMAKLKSPEFREKAGCGKKEENKHKMCRPWIGGKVEGGKPVWSDGTEIYDTWKSFPALDKQWKDGNGIHAVAIGKKPYFHDADDSWVRASFLCESD